MTTLLQLMFWSTAGLVLVFPAVAIPQAISNTSQAPTQIWGSSPDPAGQTNATAGISEPQISLGDLIDVALARNPAIKAAAERYKSQQAR
ncbi:MAG: hypothetical protein ABI197_14245, partial [Granulicella sp.]